MKTLTLPERAARTGKVLERYRMRPFSWNGASCIHLARAQAIAMGHRVPQLGTIRSAIGAKRALRDQGHETVQDLLDSLFPRVTPLAMLIGDVCTLRGEDDEDTGLAAICIADGQGNLFGWHAQDPSQLRTIKFGLADVDGAWRL